MYSRKISHVFFAFLCRNRFVVNLLSLWCWKVVIKEKNNKYIDGSKYLVLAVKPYRFRGDIEVLNELDNIQILYLANKVPGRFYRWFYGKNSCHDASSNQIIATQQKRYRTFLKQFLPQVLRRLGAVGLISSGLRYKVSVDWIAAGHEANIPSLVFHREGYNGSQHQKAQLLSFGQHAPFEGTRAVFQTNLHREIAISCGYVNNDNSGAIGNLRMDNYLASLKFGQKENNHEEWVTFFSFGISSGFLTAIPPYWPKENPKDYLYEFCRLSHVAVARFAKANPEVNVLIKTKWDGIWFENVEMFLESESLYIKDIDNLYLVSDMDVHSQIRRSKVVVGYGSTALLESAIAGIPVIVPWFAEITEERMSPYVIYPDIMDCFDIARSPDELEQLIGLRMDDNSVTESVMEMRRRAFERYISPVDSGATQRAQKLIEKEIKMKSSFRNSAFLG